MISEPGIHRRLPPSPYLLEKGQAWMEAVQEIAGMCWDQSLHAVVSGVTCYAQARGRGRECKGQGQTCSQVIEKNSAWSNWFLPGFVSSWGRLDTLAQVRCLTVSHGVLRAKLVIYELDKWKGLRKLAASPSSTSCDQQYEVGWLLGAPLRDKYY